jgi:hypothetical protein
MVLPGIQALFGFQLIAVFNASFREVLTPAGQRLHLLALALVAAAIALIMTPAAVSSPVQSPGGNRHVHQDFHPGGAVEHATARRRDLRLDFYLIARVVLSSPLVLLPALLLFLLFVVCWFVLPRAARCSGWWRAAARLCNRAPRPSSIAREGQPCAAHRLPPPKRSPSSHTPIRGTAEDYDPLLERLAGCRLVLLGESRTGPSSSTTSARASPGA